MKQLDMANAVLQWFAFNGSAGMVLPNDWVERPHENIFSLTYIKARPHKLIVELDQQLYLIFTDLGEVINVDGNLQLRGFTQLVFDWQGYSNLQPHAGVYKKGVFKFVPSECPPF